MTKFRFPRTLFLAALAGAAMLLMPATAAARVGIGFGFYGPAYPYGYWGPYGYPGYGYPYAPYGYPAPYAGRPLGKVNIKTPVDNAEIYVDGSFAGRARDLHKIYLTTGNHRLEQRIGADVQRQRINVLPYHTIHVEFGNIGTPSEPPPERPAPNAPPPPSGQTP